MTTPSKTVSRRFGFGLARPILWASLTAAIVVLSSFGTAFGADTPVATVPVGNSPAVVAVDPLTHHVFVGNYYGDSVSVIDGTTRSAVATIPMPTGGSIAVPITAVVDGLSGKAYVGNFWSNFVSVIDASTLSVVATISPPASHGSGVRALAADPSGASPKVYAAIFGKNVVSVIDGSTDSVVKNIPVGDSPRAIAVFASGSHRRVYVANRYSNDVSIIDGNTDEVVATVPTGASPKVIAVDPNRGFAYVTSTASDTVTVIDDSDRVAATIAVGDNPIGVAVDAAGRRVFVANYASNTVSVIDADTLSVVGTVATGVQPMAIAVDRSSRKVYVSCYGSSSVTMIDSSLVATSIATGYRPYALGIDEALASHQVYSANWGANNVTIIDPPGGDAGPVSVTIDPLPGDTTSSTSPVFSGIAASSRAPRQSNIVAVFYRIGADQTWRRAQITDGAGTPSVKWQAAPSGSLSEGAHTIEVAAMDQALAVSSSSDQGAGGDSAALGGAATYQFDVGSTQTVTDWYVNASVGSDSNPGDTPASPFRSVTRATLAAGAGDTVHVAAGLYGTATTGEVFPIHMIDGVLQGAGSGSVTLLGNGLVPVIEATGIGSTAKIDGFTITGGSPGLDLSGSTLTISNNVISGNTGDLAGGGIHSLSGNVHIVNNVIRENTATYGGGIVIEGADSSRIESNTIENNVVTQGGGGIDVYLNARPTISHNIIRNNSARMGGGIMSESGSLPRVTETVIQGNSADPTGGGKGGAIACFSASVVLENCLITGNNSSDYAISGINSAATRIVNCTIADNSSAGIGRFNTAWSFSVEVKNSILRNAGAEIDSGTVATISYSDVEGGYTGAGNIDADPRFVDPPADYRLAPASPCIDAGAADTTVVSDLDGVARPVGSGWDMGAYESTVVTPPDITAPAVQITSPSSGAVVSGDVAITAVATDEQSGIARVEFRVDGALISSSAAEPYAATWDASAATAGSHTIQVTAYDGAGNSASASETVTIPAPDTTPPTVSIMVPDDGTVVSGIVWFGAGAGDTGSGISRVEFRADGDLFYTAWGGYMYIADWDSTGAAPGPHVIEVTAYDIAGNSASTSITVVTLDTTAPVVSITSPNDSAVVAGRVSITAAAADADSDIVRVDFAVDGATTASDTTSPYSADWNATGAAVGDHIISATAYDGAGNSAVATCTVSVAAKQLKKPKRTLGTATTLAGPSSMKTYRALRLTGTVSPGGPGTVKITMQRRVGTKWRSAGHVHVNVLNGRYTYSPRLKHRGSWRFVASYSGGVSDTDEYGSSRSRTKTVRVR